MKRPSLRFDKEALLGFLLNHCEKFVVGLVGLIGLVLAWNGVNALRIKSVANDRTPEAISQMVTQTAAHIEKTPKPPAEAIRKGGDLVAAIDPWRPQQVKIVAPPELVLLNRPLVQELATRAKPEVFPIGDLQAVAGIAVVPDPVDPTAPPVVPRRPDTDAGGEGAVVKKPKPPRRGEEQPAEPPPQEFNEMGQQVARARVVPYVMVTGLVPVAKQFEEYRRAFGNSGFRDPQRDRPRWAEYFVERSAVGVAGTPPKWERLKLRNIDTFGQAAGAGAMPPGQATERLQQDVVPPMFLLGNEDTDIGYVAALPERVDEPWGLETVHPWFRSQIRKLIESATAGLDDASTAPPIDPKRLRDTPKDFEGQVGILQAMQVSGEPQRLGDLVAFTVKSADGSIAFPVDLAAAGDQPVFVMSASWARVLELDDRPKRDVPCSIRVRMEQLGRKPVAHILGLTYPPAEGDVEEELADPYPFPISGAGLGEFAGSGGLGDASSVGFEGPEFRLFRFLDTSVKPGQRYRYRVRISLHNPNFGLDRQHLADPASARQELLPLKDSDESPPVTVPDPKMLLLRMIAKEPAKQPGKPPSGKAKLKPGSYELLVIAPGARSGDFEMSSVITEVGGWANVDAGLNKPGDVRTKGANVTTDRVLVDVRGRQEESGKPGVPTEMLEMLLLKPDGSFDFVSAADSQRLVNRYLPTLEPPPDPTTALPPEFSAPPPSMRRGGNK